MPTTNRILDIDSYKCSSFLQYPEGTTKLEGYLEASIGAPYPYTMFFGLQYLLEECLRRPFLISEVEEASQICKLHGVPFPYEGWKRLVEVHKGFVPLKIKAVKEGTVVPVNNVLMTIESTDPQLPWLVEWFETQLARLWYPITVATRAFNCKQIIFKYLLDTADNPNNEINSKLYNFGSREVSSAESAMIGGMAHLCNFTNTNKMIAVMGIQKYYKYQYYNGKDPKNRGPYIKGFSIPAIEHSIIASWGEETETIKNIIDNSDYQTIASVYNFDDVYSAVENVWCGSLLSYIKDRNKTIIICNNSNNPSTSLEILNIMEKKIGMTTNTKGYKVLPPYYRIMQGNINEYNIANLLNALKLQGYSASNIGFGMGGELLQKLDCHTQGFDFKLSQITVNGIPRNITSSPKFGHLDLIKLDGEYKTISRLPNEPETDSLLQLVYYNGTLSNYTDFEKIRKRANESFAELTPTI